LRHLGAKVLVDRNRREFITLLGGGRWCEAALEFGTTSTTIPPLVSAAWQVAGPAPA
jgi:hypothetical protein